MSTSSTELVNLDTVYFNREEIPVMMLDGVPYVAIRPVCDILSLDFSSQRKRIMRDPVLSSTVVMMTTVGFSGWQREMLFLPLDYLNGWLFGIDANRVKPELRDKIIAYQRECYGILAAHFGLAHKATIERIESKASDLAFRLYKAERVVFKRHPHWEKIRDLLRQHVPYEQIAWRVNRSVSACRRAVKRMFEMGIVTSLEITCHKVYNRKLSAA